VGSGEKRPEGGDSERRPAPVDPACYDEGYFLSECEGHQQFAASGGGLLSARLYAALARADVGPGMRVLDIGCGRGESLIWLSRQGATSWGLDYSEAALRIARRTLAASSREERSRCLALAADAKHLPFAPGCFHRVLMLDIVEHLHPWELALALEEARRVLAPEGMLVVHTAPNRWYYRFGYPLYRLYQRLRGLSLPRDPRDRFPSHGQVHVNEQSPLSLRRGLGRAGFRVRVWVGDTQERWRGQGRLGTLAGWIVTHAHPLKWVFCGDLFAIGWKGREGSDCS